MKDGVPRLAYLVSQYPSISHTFILREIVRLRGLGFDIEVASINSPDRGPGGLTKVERKETETTFYVKAAGLHRLAHAHLASLSSRPRKYFRGLLYALRLGGVDLKKILYQLFYFMEAVVVGEWAARVGARHLHVHFATPAATVGLIAKRIFGLTLSLTIHGPDEFYDVTAYQLQEKIRSSSFVFCIGLFARSQLMKLSPVTEWHKFEVTPLGVDLKEFSPLTRPASPDTFEVLCVGRLVPAKGQHILLQALQLLVQDGRSVRLRLVGAGPDEPSLRQMVRDKKLDGFVRFEGAVNQDRIRELYGQADLFVLPSFAEGIPVVLMEAMAMEIPCISTLIAGIPELIQSGRDGILIPPSDAESLADEIARMMDTPSVRRHLGRSGRIRVQENYNLAKNVANLAHIFERRLDESRGEAFTDCEARRIRGAETRTRLAIS